VADWLTGRERGRERRSERERERERGRERERFDWWWVIRRKRVEGDSDAIPPGAERDDGGERTVHDGDVSEP
jgi:hypothetical protein